MLDNIVEKNLEDWLRQGIVIAVDMLKPIYKEYVMPILENGLKHKLVLIILILVVCIVLVSLGYTPKKAKKSAKKIVECCDDVFS